MQRPLNWILLIYTIVVKLKFVQRPLNWILSKFAIVVKTEMGKIAILVEIHVFRLQRSIASTFMGISQENMNTRKNMIYYYGILFNVDVAIFFFSQGIGKNSIVIQCTFHFHAWLIWRANRDSALIWIDSLDHPPRTARRQWLSDTSLINAHI